MSAVNFLVNTLFDLYLMVVLLRVWLQVARADFYNPFSQFIVKATQPVVAPLRRFIPSLGGWDTATIVFCIYRCRFKNNRSQSADRRIIKPDSTADLCCCYRYHSGIQTALLGINSTRHPELDQPRT